jgi:hypothetical protein
MACGPPKEAALFNQQPHGAIQLAGIALAGKKKGLGFSEVG